MKWNSVKTLKTIAVFLMPLFWSLTQDIRTAYIYVCLAVSSKSFIWLIKYLQKWMQMQYNQFHITLFYRKDGRQLTLLRVLELCYWVNKAQP